MPAETDIRVIYNNVSCPYCGQDHDLYKCPRVAAIEWYPVGEAIRPLSGPEIKRVEFFPGFSDIETMHKSLVDQQITLSAMAQRERDFKAQLEEAWKAAKAVAPRPIDDEARSGRLVILFGPTGKGGLSGWESYAVTGYWRAPTQCWMSATGAPMTGSNPPTHYVLMPEEMLK